MKVVVVGGGPAGMMASIEARKQGNDVILVEKMNSLGRKLLITGKGRCNITSAIPIQEFVNHIPGNGKFLYSAFQNYTNQDIVEFMKEQGVCVKEERGSRIFPVTDRSVDVLKAFTSKLKELKITILTNAKVTQILVEEEKVTGVKYIKEGKQEWIEADKVILATGGKSYPSTGSTGDGYQLAKQLGHTITEIRPSLVPLRIEEIDICKQLQGLSLRNSKIKIVQVENKKVIYEDFGELLFTHFGVSGPTILSGSAVLLRYKNARQLLQEKKVKLMIDLKPALTIDKLDARILRDFKDSKNKQLKNSLEKLLPQKMIPVMIQESKIDPEKRVNEITKQERQQFIKKVKQFELTVKDFMPIENAIVTAGGVNIKEINPKTMESKKIKGLYFAGEIMDVDAFTGGFNLQIAYSTGVTAGK